MQGITTKAKHYVENRIENELSPGYHFHSIEHIRETVDAVQQIGQHSGLDDIQLEILTLAAWFHDIGHVYQYEGHEEKSAEIARAFLEQNHYPKERIKEVERLILATGLEHKPEVTENTVSRDDIEKRKGNLLFFGNFYKMELADYQWGMRELMRDGDYLYSNLMQDIYYLGLVLARKYKFLRIAYSVFMYGIILSVASFLLSMYVFTPE